MSQSHSLRNRLTFPPHPPAPAAKGSKHGSGNANAPPSSRVPGWEGPVSTIAITSVSLSPLVLVITLTTTTGRDVLQHPSVLLICTIYNFLHQQSIQDEEITYDMHKQNHKVKEAFLKIFQLYINFQLLIQTLVNVPFLLLPRLRGNIKQ